MSNFGLCPGHCEGVSWRREFLFYVSEECSFVFVVVGSAVGFILKTLPLGSSSNLISVLVFFLLKSIHLAVLVLVVARGIFHCGTHAELPMACGIWFPDQGSNPSPLHQKEDS